MYIAWTTLATRADAEKLASETVTLELCACAQVEGPIVSHYLWQGWPERTEEFRICFKFLPDSLAALEAHVVMHHTYAVPEWVVVRAEHVGEKYLSWAGATGTKLPL